VDPLLSESSSILEISIAFNPLFVIKTHDLISNGIILMICVFTLWHWYYITIYACTAKAKDTDENPEGNSSSDENEMLERKK